MIQKIKESIVDKSNFAICDKKPYVLVPRVPVHIISVDSDDAVVEEDSSDEEPVRKI